MSELLLYFPPRRSLSLSREVVHMKLLPVFLLSTALSVVDIASGQGTKDAAAPSPPKTQPSQQPQPTITSAVDREISLAENAVVEAAEAMPEEKFNFSPEGLDIPGSDYKGVRTFALQVKHIAASNYAIWSALTGDKLPDNFKGGNGPEELKTKAEIMRFLKDSFALGHKAAATLTVENAAQPVEGGKASRLYLTTFGAAHAFNHYGQMVEYLRMNGIVPPASRKRAD